MDAYPKPVIGWKSPGNKTILEDSRFSITTSTLPSPPYQGHYVSKLEFSTAHASDLGVYVCEAANKVGSWKFSVELAASGASAFNFLFYLNFFYFAFFVEIIV